MVVLYPAWFYKFAQSMAALKLVFALMHMKVAGVAVRDVDPDTRHNKATAISIFDYGIICVFIHIYVFLGCFFLFKTKRFLLVSILIDGFLS